MASQIIPLHGELLSIQEVASLLAVTESVIRKIAIRGELPYREIGGEIVFQRSAIEAFTKGQPIALDDRFLAKLDLMLDALDRIDRGIRQLVEHNARRSGMRPGLKPVLRNQVIERDGLVCRYCSRYLTRDTLVTDHVRPVILGGATELDNLVVSCIPCNKKKAGYTLEEVCMTLQPVPKQPRRTPHRTAKGAVAQ